MSEYKPITGELRGSLADINWAEIVDHMQTSSGAVVDGDWLDHWHEHAEYICDSIDSVHAALEAENERLHGEWDFWESTHVELPKDTDGERIHVGDMVKLPNCKSDEVRFMTINGAGWLINESGWLPCEVSHSKPDTWERIIEDAVNVHGNGFNPCWADERDALVVRCKALAGEDE